MFVCYHDTEYILKSIYYLKIYLTILVFLLIL